MKSVFYWYQLTLIVPIHHIYLSNLNNEAILMPGTCEIGGYGRQSSIQLISEASQLDLDRKVLILPGM